MSAFLYDQAMHLINTGSLNPSTDTLKLMLVTSSYTAAKSDTGVNTASASEIVATNYTAGFGGAGRKTVSPLTITKDATNHIDRWIFPATVTWTTLGGATNATVAGGVLIKEVTNDTASILVAYFSLTSTTTSGVNYQLTFDQTNGNVTFSL